MVENTVNAKAGVGFLAFLTAYFGQLGGDVVLVIISCMVGCMISLTKKKLTPFQTLHFVFLGVSSALVLSWPIASVLGSYIPSVASPDLPSLVSLAIGFLTDRLFGIFSGLTAKIEEKFEVKE